MATNLIYFTYETKCRRCGRLNTWAGPEADKVDYKSFQDMMYSHIQEPRLYTCTQCERMTIQDVVAYDGPSGSPIPSSPTP